MLPVVALAGVVPALVFLVLAVRALPAIDRSTLSTGARFASAASSALLLLDPSMLAAVVENQRWRAVGRVRTGRFRPARNGGCCSRPTCAGSAAIRPRSVGGRCWSSPCTPCRSRSPPWPRAVQVIAAFLAADRFAGGLRGIARSAGLRRAIGGTDASLKLTHLLVPAAAAILFWLATVPAVGAGPTG